MKTRVRVDVRHSESRPSDPGDWTPEAVIEFDCDGKEKARAVLRAMFDGTDRILGDVPDVTEWEQVTADGYWKIFIRMTPVDFGYTKNDEALVSWAHSKERISDRTRYETRTIREISTVISAAMLTVVYESVDRVVTAAKYDDGLGFVFRSTQAKYSDEVSIDMTIICDGRIKQQHFTSGLDCHFAVLEAIDNLEE